MRKAGGGQMEGRRLVNRLQPAMLFSADRTINGRKQRMRRKVLAGRLQDQLRTGSRARWSSLVAPTVMAIAACLFMLGQSSTPAAAQNIELEYGVDYPGNDFRVHRNVTLGYCSSQCIIEQFCVVFTYDNKHGWCFLKNYRSERNPVDFAISGTIWERQ